MTANGVGVLPPYHYDRPPVGSFGSFLMVGDRLVCHICGRDYLNLQSHVWAMHGLLADEYRQVFRLLGSTPLWAASVSRKLTESNERRLRADPESVRTMSALAVGAERRRVRGLHRPRRRANEATRALMSERLRARWVDVPVAERTDRMRRMALTPRDPVVEAERRLKISRTQKGRTHNWSAPGERNGQAKLTEADVRAIRAAHGSGASLLELAALYRVSRSLIWLVAKRKAWSHLAD